MGPSIYDLYSAVQGWILSHLTPCQRSDTQDALFSQSHQQLSVYTGQRHELVHPGPITNGFDGLNWFMWISRENVLLLPRVLPMEANAASGISANTRNKGRKKEEAAEANEKPPAAVFSGRGCEDKPLCFRWADISPSSGGPQNINILKLDFHRYLLRSWNSESARMPQLLLLDYLK